jgi:FkbM family methyltransferase
MSPLERQTILGSLRVLFNKGVRYSTVIDVGCADGYFFMQCYAMGLFSGAVPVNIDANVLYEDSLAAIKNAIGGHFRISAVTDKEGEIELTTSKHPYWSSLRPEGDPYWQRINRLSDAKVVVPATTLDALYEELSLKPPFLLRLDVQGAEESALRGAGNLLKDTCVLICEADIDDFQNINGLLERQGFVLYDITELCHLGDGTLGWFYPVYISHALDFVRPKEFWDEKDNEKIIRVQLERRRAILKSNAEILARMQNEQRPVSSIQPSKPVRRLEPCPCGSGRKYKHCCGAYS